jgi:hypothetical protein
MAERRLGGGGGGGEGKAVAFGWRRGRVHGGGSSRGAGCSESHISACFFPIPARTEGLQRIKGNVQRKDNVLTVPPISAVVI